MRDDCGVWRYNRHDRRRGTEPPEHLCRGNGCGANLHEAGIHTYEGYRYLTGRFVPGELDGGVVMEVLVYTEYSVPVYCNECNAPQPHLFLESVEFDPNSVTEQEEAAVEMGEAEPEVVERYGRLVLNM